MKIQIFDTPEGLKSGCISEFYSSILSKIQFLNKNMCFGTVCRDGSREFVGTGKGQKMISWGPLCAFKLANFIRSRLRLQFILYSFQAISDVLGFKFKLYSVPDHFYGVQDPDSGEWNGIVRQLLDRRADLAVASMTINHARETVIDFTKPFMNLGISILFKAPKDPATELFSFMNPLAVEIWMYILIGNDATMCQNTYFCSKIDPWQNNE